MDQKQFEIICKKLDKLTALLVVQNIENKDDKVYELKKMGLTSEEVGSLVGIVNVRKMEGWKRK